MTGLELNRIEALEFKEMKDLSGLKSDIKNFCEENGSLKAALLDNLLDMISS